MIFVSGFIIAGVGVMRLIVYPCLRKESFSRKVFYGRWETASESFSFDLAKRNQVWTHNKRGYIWVI